MDEVDKLKQRYSQQIEDGRKIEVVTSMPEWNWYVEFVIQPTIDDYTNRILSGTILTDKEDWTLRGMIMGMKLVIDTTDNFKRTGRDAQKKAKDYQKFIDDES